MRDPAAFRESSLEQCGETSWHAAHDFSRLFQIVSKVIEDRVNQIFRLV